MGSLISYIHSSIPPSPPREEIISLFQDMSYAIRVALPGTFQAILQNPLLLLHPFQLRRVLMSFIWNVYGVNLNENTRELKSQLITPHASGIVLDLGAGHGHTISYLSEGVITYIAVEPNVAMHEKIRRAAASQGYTEESGTLIILGCGAEDIEEITGALEVDGVQRQVDTIISILSLCSVLRPQETITNLVEQVLKPGGNILIHEHVRHPSRRMSYYQTLLTPIWTNVFDGCKLNRDTISYLRVAGKETASRQNIKEQTVWIEQDIWDEGTELEESFLPRVTGRFVKGMSKGLGQVQHY